MMLKAKEAVIRNQFFPEPRPWWMPKVHSILPSPLFLPRRGEDTCSEFPETADTGETLAAFRAGAWAASRTVTRPTRVPLISPTGLRETTGMAANSSPPMP